MKKLSKYAKYQYNNILTKEFLIKEYIIKKKSTPQIAKRIGCSDVAVLRYLRKFNIPIRTNSQAQTLLKRTGKNNPNYKHGKCCTPNYCIDCHKEIDKWGRSKRCHKCAGLESLPFKGKRHTKENKKIIGLKSKAKFTKEYLKKQRKNFEKLGIWVPLEKIKPYTIYSRKANWKKEVFNYLSKKELKSLRKTGLFSFQNTKGMVRDHKYSRYSGFVNKVPAILLRHPANCELITHAENLSKARKNNRYKDSNSISLTKLFNLIENFKLKWYEQGECMKAIRSYRRKNVVIGGKS